MSLPVMGAGTGCIGHLERPSCPQQLCRSGACCAGSHPLQPDPYKQFRFQQFDFQQKRQNSDEVQIILGTVMTAVNVHDTYAVRANAFACTLS